MLENHKSGDHHTDIADDVHHKRFACRQHSAFLFCPETDEQVRRQAHKRPADDQEKEIRRQHQQRHGKNKQIQVSKEPAELLVMVHVADGVNMNESPHSRHNQQHKYGQRIDQDRKIQAEAFRYDPGVKGLNVIQPIGRVFSIECDQHEQGHQKRTAHRRTGKPSHRGNLGIRFPNQDRVRNPANGKSNIKPTQCEYKSVTLSIH